MTRSYLTSRRQFLQSTGIVTTALIASALPLTAASTESESVLDLDPSRENPRNSEGAFVTLKSGRILFLYTRFHGGAGDASPARIVSIHSDDAGSTWQQVNKEVVENTKGANVMSVSLLRLNSERIALFYLVKNNLLDCRPYVRFSYDEALNWSEPQLVRDAPGYFVLNNDRVIQLKSGRLVMPIAFHRSRGSEPHDYKSWDSRGIALWYLSDDEGKTWQESADWWSLPVRSRTGFQEPGVVELADGRLFSWMRTDQGAQYGCWSTDSGKTWPFPEKASLASPESPASIKRIPDSDDLLAIYNDHSGLFPFPNGKRTPLAAGISKDGGKSWTQRKVIEPDPAGWYCYTAIHFVNDSVLLAYCAGDPKVGGLNRLRIRRMSLQVLRS